jgi:hypothetical protein
MAEAKPGNSITKSPQSTKNRIHFFILPPIQKKIEKNSKTAHLQYNPIVIRVKAVSSSIGTNFR